MTIYRFFKRSAFTFAYIYRRFHEEGCAYRATVLAYTTLLALVPLTIIAFTLLSFVPAFRGVGIRLQNLIWENFVPTSASMVAAYLSQLTQNVTGLSIMNIFFLGIVAVLLMYNINRAFVAIWYTKHRFQLSLHFLIYFYGITAVAIFIRRSYVAWNLPGSISFSYGPYWMTLFGKRAFICLAICANL